MRCLTGCLLHQLQAFLQNYKSKISQLCLDFEEKKVGVAASGMDWPKEKDLFKDLARKLEAWHRRSSAKVQTF